MAEGDLFPMKPRMYLIVTSVIFGLVSIGHGLRFIFQWHVQVGAWVVPEWISLVAVVVAGVMSIGAFRLSGK